MYKDIDRVTFPHCQKVLPLTYDNSLSYYEAICKLVDKVNDIIGIINIFDPPDLQPIYDRLDAIEAVNEQQSNDIDYLNECCKNVQSALQDIIDRLTTLEGRVDSISSIVTIHTATLENHEERITELEKYQSQLLLKKEYAIDDDLYVFDMRAEEYEREDY